MKKKRKHWWIIVNKETGASPSLTLTTRDKARRMVSLYYSKAWKVIKVVEANK